MKVAGASLVFGSLIWTNGSRSFFIKYNITGSLLTMVVEISCRLFGDGRICSLCDAVHLLWAEASVHLCSESLAPEWVISSASSVRAPNQVIFVAVNRNFNSSFKNVSRLQARPKKDGETSSRTLTLLKHSIYLTRSNAHVLWPQGTRYVVHQEPGWIRGSRGRKELATPRRQSSTGGSMLYLIRPYRFVVHQAASSASLQRTTIRLAYDII